MSKSPINPTRWGAKSESVRPRGSESQAPTSFGLLPTEKTGGSILIDSGSASPQDADFGGIRHEDLAFCDVYRVDFTHVLGSDRPLNPTDR